MAATATSGPVPAPLYVAPRRDLTLVYRRRRFVAAVLLAALVVGLVLAMRAGMATLGGVPASAPEGNITGPPARVVVVQPGDTVWTIARAVQPDGDVRPLVDTLLANHPAPLQPGDHLLVPIDG
jgi:hypothetical protein